MRSMRSKSLLVATFGTGVLFIASAISVGTAPDANDSGTRVVQWFRENGTRVRWSVWFLAISMISFAVFASLIRSRLPRPHRDVFFFGAVTLVAESIIQAWILAALAWHTSSLEPGTARVLLDVADYWGPLLTTATVLMLSPIALLAFHEEAGLPRWLAVISGITVAEQLIETVTIFGRSGFIAPGGPMNLQLGAGLTLLALGATGIVLASKGRQNDDARRAT